MFSWSNKMEFIPLTQLQMQKNGIVSQLRMLVDMKYTGHQIIDVLQMFRHKFGCRREEEKRRGQQWNFRALRSQHIEQLPELCKQLASFLLIYQHSSPILMMGSQISKSVNYSKKQIYYILVLMFFCLTPKQESDNRGLEYQFSNMNNFAHIFTFSVFKTKCIIEYFQRQRKTIFTDNSVMTIIRKVAKSPIQSLIASNKKLLMTKIKIEQNQTSIESFVGDIKIDFANRYVGGGCLTNGCVQEEIMFALRPELLATTLLCQKMRENEALAFIGFTKHFKCKGYGRENTQYNGRQNMEYDYIKNKDQQLAEEYIVAIDAIKFQKNNPQQFKQQFLNREILKAYTGFTAIQAKNRIVTGNWGCGVYNGDHLTKLVIQWIAATLADKQMIYCPFGMKRLIEEDNLLSKLKGKQVGYIYLLLIEAGALKVNHGKYFRQSILQIMTGLMKQ